ncbi:Na+/H+ antiporter NhaC [Mobilibacterium timonense]|uniref:Na+/H+ antiporter NhaC n=1 Tax=Mobilibacterium timonense TaxID=1871012 RepID=UPI003A9504F9
MGMKDKDKKPERKLTISGSILILAVIFATIIGGIRLGYGTNMSLFAGAFEAMIACLILRKQWDEVQKPILDFMSGTLVVCIILIDVGIMVGSWIIGGTVSSLMYYGLKLISPNLVVPMAFLLCAVMSIFTGTSFGSIATMGIAVTGVAIGVGVPMPLVAGAVVAGAHVGDKMSPMSDSTNLCSGVAGVDLYDHIGSMMHTTVPAALISLILYWVMGMRYTGNETADKNVHLMLNTLDANFNISLLALVPAILMIVIAVARIPAVLGLTACSIFSVFYAILMQGCSLSEVMVVAQNGYASDTGVELVDGILNRGGMSSMMGTVGMIMLACMMGGALQATGALKVFMDNVLMKRVKSARSLVVITMIYNYLILAVSGNQMLGAVMSGPAFAETYDEMNIHRKVLTRCMGDTTINGSALIPWSVATVYAVGVLGTGNASFIPYEFFCYIVPVFTLISAFTGWAMWHSDGTPFIEKKALQTE